MKDFADIPNSSGSFPDVTAVDCSGPGETDGTAIIADTMTDYFGAVQELLTIANITPDDSAEAVGASQIVEALRELIKQDPAWAMNLIDSDHAGSYSGAFYVAYYGGSGYTDDKYFVLGGSSGEIETSNYGIDWTQQTPAGSFSGSFYGGCYAESLDLYLLVGSGGEIQTASDPTGTWTNRTPDGSYSDDFRAACWSESLDLYVIVGDSGEIQTSPDGINWTARTAAASYSGDFDCALWSEDLSLFIIAGTSGEIQTSPDGTNWTHRDPPASYSGTYTDIAEGRGQIVLISTSVIHGSADGITWYERDTTPSNMDTLIYGNGLFLVSAFLTTFTEGIWYSSNDGINWNAIDLTTDDSDFLCAAYGFNRFIFAGDTSYNPCIQVTHRHG